MARVAWDRGDDQVVRLAEVALGELGGYEDVEGRHWDAESARAELTRLAAEGSTEVVTRSGRVVRVSGFLF